MSKNTKSIFFRDISNERWFLYVKAIYAIIFIPFAGLAIYLVLSDISFKSFPGVINPIIIMTCFVVLILFHCEMILGIANGDKILRLRKSLLIKTLLIAYFGTFLLIIMLCYELCVYIAK